MPYAKQKQRKGDSELQHIGSHGEHLVGRSAEPGKRNTRQQ